MTVASFLGMLNGIRADFDANIAVPLTLPTQYDNGPFTKPPIPSTWARMTLLVGESDQIELGGPTRTFRTTAIMAINLFGGLEVGDAGLVTIADAIANRYRATTRAGALFLTPTINRGVRDEPYWSVPVFCPFHADMFK
jgi:hypothetical protein